MLTRAVASFVSDFLKYFGVDPPHVKRAPGYWRCSSWLKDIQQSLYVFSLVGCQYLPKTWELRRKARDINMTNSDAPRPAPPASQKELREIIGQRALSVLVAV